MNKINVSVFLPALSKSYDAVLPPGMKIGAAAILLAGAISEQESIHISEDSLMLALKDSGKIIDDDTTVYNAGIRDGHTLILV